MDPLAKLNDIHLPANVHSYPIAPGWWLLAIVILAVIIYGVLKLRHVMAKRKAQKIALKQLSSTTEISAMVSLLKWAALQYFSRGQVAHLTGAAFKSFLIATLPAKHQQKFADLSAEHFTSVYRSDAANITATEFSAAAKLWLSHALPPKTILPPLAAVEHSTTAVKAKSREDIAENGGVKS